MVKGKGIFVNPASAAAPAKLRVLYEVGPIAYLIEKAGGKSSDGENSALDIKIPHTEVRHSEKIRAISALQFCLSKRFSLTGLLTM